MKVRSLVLSAAAALTLSAAPARALDLYVVHGIPGADGVGVCATIDGGAPIRVIDSFNFGDYRALKGLPAGLYTAKVVVGDCSQPAAFGLEIGPVALGAEDRVAVAAHLKYPASSGVALSAFPLGNPASLEAREGFLGAYHVAAAPTVDVVVNGKAVVTASNGVGAPFAVRSQPYAVWLSLPGRKNPLVSPVNVRVPDGGGFYVFAVGVFGEPSFRYVTFSLSE